MGTGWGAGLLPLDRPEKKPSLCSPPVQVPDGATVRLIPQLHNGGAVSQSLAQSCSSGESESRNPDVHICPRELEAARQESRPCCHLGLPTPCQRASQSSWLSKGPGADEGSGVSRSRSSRAMGCRVEQAPGRPPSFPHHYPLLPWAPPSLYHLARRGGVGSRA